MFYSKSPEFKTCVLNFTSTIDECLDPGEKDSKKILEEVTEALLAFVCHDDGDRIACKKLVYEFFLKKYKLIYTHIY